VGIPPFNRLNRNSGDKNTEVKMISPCHPGSTTATDHLTTGDNIARLNIELAHVSIERLQAKTVIDNDTETVNPQILRPDNLAAILGNNPGLGN